MVTKEILKRVEEIEDHMEAAKKLESPPTGWSDTAWLCKTVRELVSKAEELQRLVWAICYLHEQECKFWHFYIPFLQQATGMPPDWKPEEVD